MDIKDFNRLFLFLVICVLTSSCASTNGLYKSFTKSKATLVYLHDTDSAMSHSNVQVSIEKPVINDPKFSMPGMVRKTKSTVIPLIIYTSWKAQYDYRLGSVAIEEDISSFLQSSLISESKRSGIFQPVTAATPDMLSLEIEVDSLGGTTPYVSEGYVVFLFFAYTSYSAESAGIGTAYSRFHFKLKQGDKILLEDYVSNTAQAQPLIQKHKSTKALRTYTHTSLVESLALTFKSNTESIVRYVNKYLQYQKDPLNIAQPVD